MRQHERHLHERDRELVAIERLIDDACSGTGATLVVEGPPGTGRSSLLDAAASRSLELGMTVLRCRGTELESDFSYGAAMQLFERRLALLARQERVALSEPAKATAELIERGELATGRGSSGDPASGLCSLAESLAAIDPLLVIADDAQWIDPPSLHFLRVLGRRIATSPIGLLIASNNGVEGRRSIDLIVEAAATRRVTTSVLGPDAVAAVVREWRAGSPDELCTTLLELTAGNPRLVHELLEELGPTEPSGDASEAWNALAAGVSRLTRSRLSRLPEPSQEVAATLAVLGHDASAEHLAALADLDVEQVQKETARLRTEGLLNASDPPRFQHSLIEDAVEAGIPLSRRSTLHQRAALLLKAAGEEPRSIALHLVHVLPAGEPEVVEALREGARDDLRGGDPESAVRLLRRALDEPPSRKERHRIVRELAEAEAEAGIAGAAERLEETIPDIPSGPERADALLRLGTMLRDGGRGDEAIATLERALTELEEGDVELGARIKGEHASLASVDYLRRESTTGVVEGLIGRIAVGAPVPASALAAVALRLALGGERREEALALAERAGEVSGGRLGTASIDLAAEVTLYGDEPARALELNEVALADARRRGSIPDTATALSGRARTLLRLGRIPGSIADASEAIAAERFGWRRDLPSIYAILAEGLIARGEVDAAARRLTELEEAEWLQARGWASMLGARGALEALRGRTEQALSSFTEQGERTVSTNPAMQRWRSSAALVAARLGRVELAQALALEELELARRWGAPGPIGVALRALGVVVGGEEGLGTLREAAAILRPLPLALDRWQAEIELGTALRRAGRRVEAREGLRACADQSAEMGAIGVAARAREEIALTGERSDELGFPGVEPLTAGELRVARLAADGMTNRQIAESLQVTPKAVQWHLRNTYRKLEIEGRAALADALRR